MQMSFAQRAQTASVPLPRTPEPVVPATETPLQPVPHSTVVSQRRSDAFDATISKFFMRRKSARDATYEQFENSKFAEPAPSFSVPVPHLMSNTPAVPSTLPADPVDTHAHVPTQIDERDKEPAVDKQSADPFQFDDPPVVALVILPQRNSGYDHRDDLPRHVRTQFQQSRIRQLARSLEPDAKLLRLDAGKRAVLMLSQDVSFGSECCKHVTVFKHCGKCSSPSSSCEQGSAVRCNHETAAGTRERWNDS